MFNFIENFVSTISLFDWHPTNYYEIHITQLFFKNLHQIRIFLKDRYTNLGHEVSWKKETGSYSDRVGKECVFT